MKKIIAFVTLFLFALVGFSMNIRSIEIQYEPINNLTYKARVICYVYEHGDVYKRQGVCATAIVINNLFNKSFPISIHTQGGELQINEFIENEKKILTLRGPATLVFITDKYYL